MIRLAPLQAQIASGLFYTLLLTVFFILFSWQSTAPITLWTALPYFLILYFILFTMDRPAVSAALRNKLPKNYLYLFLFPLLLVGLFYSYLLLNGENPFKGALLLLPYLLLFPVMVFALRGVEQKEIRGFDFLVFFLFFFPVTLVKIEPQGELPFGGGGFDSMYRIVIMLTAIFAFGIIRNLRDMGAYPVFSPRALLTTIWVWLAFYSFVFAISYPIGFIRFSAANALDMERAEVIVRKMVAIFLHTALFEELVFRGILQNMLAKKIGASAGWRPAWWKGFAILTLLSLVVGYSMKGGANWFPALITTALFLAAWLLERSRRQKSGGYTALAITSVLFGLVHFHSGSIIFTALASIGGWAYGYAYLKTKSTFYAALLHTLVNASPLIFGLELAK